MNTFQKTAIITLIATLILIAVGSLVRVSGAGLGCPDWPRCWGCWFPPSSIEEIDAGYLKEKGISIEDFNPTKMWIEYINRLVGVTIGLLVLATFFRALPYRQTQPRIFWGALLAVFLVGFSGWLGGQVVQSGLKPGMITLHMVSAMMLLCVLLYVTFLAVQSRVPLSIPNHIHRRLIHLSTLLFVIIALQMLLGTQVREAVDPYIKNNAGLDRSAWMTTIGWIDHIHRSFTWLVIAAVAFFVYTVYKHNIHGFFRTLTYTNIVLIIAQTIFGILLAYGGLPHVFQILHLFSASLLICATFALVLLSRQQVTDQTSTPG
ncbi:MAG: COX15/CtaA family protein [Candidatus Latescibacteria bacterium]|nr:COX15/CtaA family protein [Candidatus Latescibacterota bacterium]